MHMHHATPPADRDRLYRDVHFLTSIRPYRNHKNIESLRAAAGYIEGELSNCGLPTRRQPWQVNGNTYENVIASFQPEKRQRFIVGAHYDVYKEQEGADDNASGVAGMLELARLLQPYAGAIDHGIDFVAYSLEEPPFFKTKDMGSYIHARSLHEQGMEIIGMLSLEMIGYYDGPGTEPRPDKHFIGVSGIASHLAFNRNVAQLLRRNPRMGARMLSFPDGQLNNGPSDHRNYWAFGYPGVMLIGTAGHRNPHYHKATDTIETLDFGSLAQAVNSIAHVMTGFKDGMP